MRHWRTVLVTGAGLSAIAVGAVNLAGWAAGVTGMVRLAPGLPPIVPLTGAALAGLGAALLLLQPYRPGRYRRWLGVTVSLAVAAIGAVALAEYSTGSATGLDTLLFRHAVEALMGGSAPGRPSPQSAAAFLAIGLALATLDAAGRWRYVPMILVPAGAIIAVTALFGYLYGVTYLRGTSQVTGISPETATALIVLSLGIACARPDRPPVSAFTNTGPGRLLARRMFPVLLLLPFLTGLLNIAGERSSSRIAAVTGTTTTALTIVVLIVAMTATMHVLDRADLRMRSQQEQLQALVSAASDAFVSADSRGVITEWSHQAERMFGWQRPEAIGREAAETVIPPRLRDAHRTRLRQAAQEREHPDMGRIELTVLHRDGHEIPVELALMRTGSGPGMRFHAFIHDITERLALQEERERARVQAERERYARRLEQAQRLESLGQLAGGVAHDFNNLLAVIQNYAEFAAEETAAGGAGHCPHCASALDDLGQIQQASERAVRLTRQLLAFGRRDVAQPRALDLNAAIGAMSNLLNSSIRENITLVTALDPELRPVFADRAQIEQVLLNLVVNARDAMPDGGTLTIETANAGSGLSHDLSPAPPAGGHVQFSVSDTGTGMTREVAERAFEPFFTAGPVGRGVAENAGLGLATVYGIITSGGGDVQIHSEPGNGTTVRMLVPVAGQAAATCPKDQAAPGHSHRETVLLAEDEQAVRDVASRILTQNGYEVIVASNGQQALELAGSHEGTIHLLLTDMIMPGMSGQELSAKILAARPSVQVIYMSGYTQAALAGDGILDPASTRLPKPFTAAALLSKVRQALCPAVVSPQLPAPADGG